MWIFSIQTMISIVGNDRVSPGVPSLFASTCCHGHKIMHGSVTPLPARHIALPSPSHPFRDQS